MKIQVVPRFNLLILLISAQASQCLAIVDYRYFVAGGFCAACSHGITTPIDVVKTSIQADPQEFQNDGMFSAAAKIVKKKGPSVLLAGLGPTVVGYGIEGAAKFGIYEILKPFFGTYIDDQPTAFIFASIAAGAVAALILCPAESVRIKIVTDKQYADKGLLTGLTKIIKEEGLLQMFGGFPAMLAKQIPYTMAKQVSFDMFAVFLYSLLKGSQYDMKLIVSICAAAAASVLACIFSQPGDVILTETYKGATPGSFTHVIGKIRERGGVAEFFLGTQARMVHVGGIITSQLVIYDLVKQLLGLPATGSH